MNGETTMWQQQQKKHQPVQPVGSILKKPLGGGGNTDLAEQIKADLASAEAATAARKEKEKEEAIAAYRQRNPRKQAKSSCGCGW